MLLEAANKFPLEFFKASLMVHPFLWIITKLQYTQRTEHWESKCLGDFVSHLRFFIDDY